MVGAPKWPRRILLAFVALIVVLIAGFLGWSLTPATPMPQAIQAMQSSQAVDVRTDPWLIFHPVAEVQKAGLILYPGGRVDPRAYAPAARSIAERGYLVVIVPMPLNLAVFGSEQAGEVIQAFPEIESWVIGGHSLGGVMAARFASRASGRVRGLVFWASYPAASDDLRNSRLRVASIYATRDGLTSLEDIRNSTLLLPADTLWIEIEGGNHAQFGYYGSQSGDLEAEISREKQQAILVGGTLNLMSTLIE
ncbi:MAG: alpha/beta hydrolase [Anaerolineales bacterium]|nr:MAG: alpha/beta hydrolase [Anaerolineales bacterium]